MRTWLVFAETVTYTYTLDEPAAILYYWGEPEQTLPYDLTIRNGSMVHVYYIYVQEYTAAMYYIAHVYTCIIMYIMYTYLYIAILMVSGSVMCIGINMTLYT